MKNISRVFNKIEGKIRGKLSHYPVVYAFIGGSGIILFWRGIWHIADEFAVNSVTSIIIGLVVLLATGVFVSEFIGNRLIISGLVGEKLLTEKEESEIETEESQLRNLQNTLNRVEKKISDLEKEIEEK
jgi:hypothetical protein